MDPKDEWTNDEELMREIVDVNFNRFNYGIIVWRLQLCGAEVVRNIFWILDFYWFKLSVRSITRLVP